MEEASAEHAKLISAQLVVVSNYLMKKDPLLSDILNRKAAKVSDSKEATGSSLNLKSNNDKFPTLCL